MLTNRKLGGSKLRLTLGERGLNPRFSLVKRLAKERPLVSGQAPKLTHHPGKLAISTAQIGNIGLIQRPSRLRRSNRRQRLRLNLF